jgi:hypothetical protein
MKYVDLEPLDEKKKKVPSCKSVVRAKQVLNIVIIQSLKSTIFK